ncbi:MAG: CDP-glycerol glycerophosphotransferase family protein [Oscillospiraceae bacterium]|nr:CDP-glycerol glycerophosphotransferase family protein [Oscillospiraceae bacterium]
MNIIKNLRKVKKYVRAADIADLLIVLLSWLPGKLLRLRKRHIWLVSERPEEARDNGYWFFRYVRENHPHLPVYYPIRFSAADARERIFPLGNAIRYGGFRHHMYFWAAEKNISAHIGNGFPAPFICRLFLMRGRYSFQNIFLQHGVILNKAPFLMADQNRIDLFITSTPAETAFVVQELGYPAGRVVCVGLCRYDGLFSPPARPGRILLLPTWRWRLSPEKGESPKAAYKRIAASGYVRTLQTLINDPGLEEFLAECGLELVFLLHPQMQPFRDCFSAVSPRIRLVSPVPPEQADIQTALRESAFLITDYSSISADFAYMRKPLLYYQFDEAAFREQHYPEGYFDYRRDGYGPVVTAAAEVTAVLRQAYRSGFVMPEPFRQRAEKDFIFNDREYCRRNFEAVRDFK